MTGTPPYFDVNVGVTPDDAESARCLFEFRGGIEAYCAAAARLLAKPHGIFIVVETAQAVNRTYAAATAAGLQVLARIDFIPREGKPVLINVFVMALSDSEAYTNTSYAQLSGASCGEVAGSSTIKTWLEPCVFVPHGRSPYEADGQLKDTTEISGSSLPIEFVEPRVCDGNSSSALLLTKHSSSITDTAIDCGPAGSKRKRPQVQAAKPMPAARPGELVVSIPVRDTKGDRSHAYKLLLQELGKPG